MRWNAPPEEGADVILRVVSGRVRPSALDRVSASFRAQYVPVAERTIGLVRYLIGACPTADGEHDLAVMTIWTRVDHALSALDGDLSAVRTLDGANHGEQLTSVVHYELDQAADADSGGGRPTLVRTAIGRVARGLDADVQQQLRRHMPELPGEACEAWIGRRVVDDDVEIAFVSTWTEAPVERPLDEPLWTDVADRYDEFQVSVQTILHEGVGPG